MMQKGCACRFLYGPGTDQEKITEISKALEAKTELQVEVQFYRKNGRNLQYLLLTAQIKRKIKKGKNFQIPSYLCQIISLYLLFFLLYNVKPYKHRLNSF